VHVLSTTLTALLGLKGWISSGNGCSVLEVISGCEHVAGFPIHFDIEERLIGDSAVLVADSNKAIEKLEWNPKFDCLNTILSSAWRRHQSHN
jgi:UDP-glucose 4-epimerase